LSSNLQRAAAEGASDSSVRELVGAEVLLIDRDERVQRGMVDLLSAAELHVTTADDPSDAWPLIDRRFFSVVVVDIDTPEINGGIETISTVKLMTPTSMVVALTSRKSFDAAVEALRAGAVDVIFKEPSSVEYLKLQVLSAAGRSVDEREIDNILAEVKTTHDAFLKELMEAERRAVDLEDKAKGIDPDSSLGDTIKVLVVANDDSMVRALSTPPVMGFEFSVALSAAQALDVCGSREYHIAMIAPDLHDLPSSMVINSVKAQYPDMMVLAYRPPDKQQPGVVEIVQTSRIIPVLKEWRDKSELIDRLPELSEAFRVKFRERRYTQAFRERHYEFLRKFVALKAKIDRALAG
jgi:DNA-binding NtrC family response regulator